MTFPQQDPNVPGVPVEPNGPNVPNDSNGSDARMTAPAASSAASDASIGGGAQAGAAANAASMVDSADPAIRNVQGTAAPASDGMPTVGIPVANQGAPVNPVGQGTPVGQDTPINPVNPVNPVNPTTPSNPSAPSGQSETNKTAKPSRFAWFRKQGQVGTRQAKATATASAEAFKTKHRTLAKLFFYKFDRFSLSTKLVACTLVVLIVGTVGISTAIRQLVSSYLLQKTDNQLISQRSLILSNTTMLRGSNNQSSGMGNNYFLQVRYVENGEFTGKVSTPLVPSVAGLAGNSIVSMPKLPANSQITDDMFGKPFTTSAVLRTVTNDSNGGFDLGGMDVVPNDNGSNTGGSTGGNTSSDTSGNAERFAAGGNVLQTARSPWRVAAFKWVEPDSKNNETVKGVVFIGLSLSDQIDIINTLTQYCVTVGIAIVLLGGSLSALIIRRTLRPLKRIEKTAAQIAAGDLSQRVPPAPENTEVGSLSASLNTMLARIERSFHEQEQTTEKMKRFVSDASHELRTPLAAIHGYAELYTMQRDLPGALERADESIAHIERSSQRMTVLVEDLLSLARLDEGRGIDMTQQISLTSLVADATDDLHALDPEREVTRGTVVLKPADGEHPCTLEVEEGQLQPITLIGDASRLRQVVTNIIGNVHRYTPADSPVRISMGTMLASIDQHTLATLPPTDASLRQFLDAAEVGQSMSTGTEYVVLRFEDHGPGAPAETRSQLFERFYTADPSRARAKGGTGLGLAIALSVVKAHQGFICATETPGGGLTFTIVLPLTHLDDGIGGVGAVGSAGSAGAGGPAGTGSAAAGAAGGAGMPSMAASSAGVAGASSGSAGSAGSVGQTGQAGQAG